MVEIRGNKNPCWHSHMVVNKVTGQWDSLTGNPADARSKAIMLGADWIAIPVKIKPLRAKRRRRVS